MFGDDIALDELEDISALKMKEPTDINQAPADVDAADTNEELDTSDYFGDDIPTEILGEVLNAAQQPIIKVKE